MYAAMRNEELVLAQTAVQDKNVTGYLCPNCRKPVQLISGDNKIPYFRHEIIEVRSKETIEHVYGKKILKSALITLNIPAKLEVPLASEALRADVFIELAKRRYALEFQCAPLSTKEFYERHQLYQNANIKDIWIAGRRHFLTKNIKQIHYDFMMYNQKWNNFILEIDVEKHRINLKYNLVQHDLSRQVRYKKRIFSFDEYGIQELLTFKSSCAPNFSYQIQDEINYLRKQIRQRSILGMKVAELCYQKGITIEEIPLEYFIGWRPPSKKVFLLEKLSQ